MRRTILLLAGVLLSAVTLGSDSPKEYDDKMQVDGIEGTWQITGVTFAGLKATPPGKRLMTNQRGTFTWNNSDRDTLRGNYRIDPTCKLPRLDWIISGGTFDGQTFKWIYQIDGDTLRIAGIPDLYVRRPQGFDDDGVQAFTFKRVK